MKFLITGGTGFIGSTLTRRLLAEGHQVTTTSSHDYPAKEGHPGLTRLAADTTMPGSWQEKVREQDVLINLAGRSVFHLWTADYKKQIRDSRILTTRNLIEALPETGNTILFSASAAGFYGDGGDHDKDEASDCGNGFLAEVCREWEMEAGWARRRGARVVIMRFGVILGAGGGAIATMKRPFAMGLGGPIGSGQQWFPWFHVEDLIQAFFFLLRRPDLHGIYNFTAPGLVRQKDFARALGEVLHRPAIMPTPALMMKLLLGDFGRSLLQGQRAIPRALSNMGYRFVFPELSPALREIFCG
ncbi:MAG: TIGR01777 family oxidoreductase [Desulfocapsaceae bacterium]|nr:TIGR01777 family oxidoreductase [Desulfocapsaceae bacterium]